MLLESRHYRSIFHLLPGQSILDRSGTGLFWIKELDKNSSQAFQNIHTFCVQVHARDGAIVKAKSLGLT